MLKKAMTVYDRAALLQPGQKLAGGERARILIDWFVYGKLREGEPPWERG